MLSVCIITKNEEKNIGKCLESLSGYGFELVVTDTGSTDHTREIVKKYTDRLYEFEWCDDFAAAKNFCISRASSEVVMVIDSDEFLERPQTAQLEKLYELIRQHPDKVGRVRRKNVFTRNGQQQENQEWINRIFDRRVFHYEGRIHEQVVRRQQIGIENDRRQKGQEGYETYLTPVSLYHTGYDLTPEEIKRKTERNILLLKEELAKLEQETEEIQKEQLPYTLYQLGKSYYMAGEYQTACDYFSQGLGFDLNPRLEYVIDMVETYGYALINSGQEQTALFFENIYEEFGNSADFQFLMGLIYMKNARFDAAVAEFEKAVTHPECRSAGVNSYAAWYNIGVIYECLGNVDKAKENYGKCGKYAPAQDRLKEIL